MNDILYFFGFCILGVLLLGAVILAAGLIIRGRQQVVIQNPQPNRRPGSPPVYAEDGEYIGHLRDGLSLPSIIDGDNVTIEQEGYTYDERGGKHRYRTRKGPQQAQVVYSQPPIIHIGPDGTARAIAQSTSQALPERTERQRPDPQQQLQPQRQQLPQPQPQVQVVQPVAQPQPQPQVNQPQQRGQRRQQQVQQPPPPQAHTGGQIVTSGSSNPPPQAHTGGQVVT